MFFSLHLSVSIVFFYGATLGKLLFFIKTLKRVFTSDISQGEQRLVQTMDKKDRKHSLKIIIHQISRILPYFYLMKYVP